MSYDCTRRDFMIAATTATSSFLWPVFTSPPRQSACRGTTTVLFQGDSITDADRDRVETRPNVGLGNGYPLLATAGVLADDPNREIRFYNRGVGGDKVPDLQDRWTTDVLDLRPDVLSVLIGVNDFWHVLLGGYDGTLQDYETEYGALLETTRSSLPHVKLIVLEPFVLRRDGADDRWAVDDHWFPEFSAYQAAAARVAKRVQAIFVPLQQTFNDLARHTAPEVWVADGVHPTMAGHAVIAAHWRRAAEL